MKRARTPIVAGGAVLVAALFFCLGKATRPRERPYRERRQHVNLSADPQVFESSFLGFAVGAPGEGNWRLRWQPRDSGAEGDPDTRFRFPNPAGTNKVLEIERMLDPSRSDREWARMDVIVESAADPGEVADLLGKLELRNHRKNLRLDGRERAIIGHRRGHVRGKAWSVGRAGFRGVDYWVWLKDKKKVYCFSGVTTAQGFERFQPAFDEIIQSVRFE